MQFYNLAQELGHFTKDVENRRKMIQAHEDKAMAEVRKKLGIKYIYKLTIYGSWWNRRGNQVGRNYRAKVEATTFNEACLEAARQVADKYNCSCEVIGSW